MNDWSVDVKNFKKYPEKYAVWKLEQMVNFGLDGKKLKLSDLKQYFTQLKIDPQKKRYLQFLLD